MENQLHEDQGLMDPKRFTPEQRLWIAMEKEKNTSTAEIKAQFSVKWPGKAPPSVRSTIYRIWKKLSQHHTVLDLHKGNSGRKRTGRSEENIAAVRAVLENQIDKNPDEIVCSSRRNGLNLSQSTFNRITRMDIKFHPYRVLRSQKITPHNVTLRLEMGRLLSLKSKEWYSHLSVSDEAWFSLGGHVFNRKNTVLYSPHGGGTPEQWFSESSQAQSKVMVFAIVHGSGKVLGPYFHPQEENVNQALYKRLLSHTVFPEMRRVLGQAGFDSTIWQQDGAKCHTANSVMDYLDRVFGPNMLALKSRQGDPWAPTSPDMSVCDFWLWGFLKEKVYRPMPTSMDQLKMRIQEEMELIPTEMIKEAVYSTKRRAIKLVEAKGEAFEGRAVRAGIRI